MADQGEKYTCSECKTVFVRARPDAEAKDEAEDHFGALIDFEAEPETDLAPVVVCQDCYNEIMDWVNEKEAN